MSESPEPAAHPSPQDSSSAARANRGHGDATDLRRAIVWQVAAPLSLVVLTTLVYLPSLSNDFIYDDHTLILHQRRRQHVGQLWQVFGERHWPSLPYYRPVARLTMVAQKMWHGDYAPPYHAFNAVLMGLVAAAVYATLRVPALAVARVPAWLGALLVAAHPVASSCVYPICSGRETALPALFMLVGTWCWLHCGRLWFVGSLVALAAALFSKEQAIVLPVVFIVADWLGLAACPAAVSTRWWLRRYGAVFLLTAAYLVLRLVIFQDDEGQGLRLVEQPILVFMSALYAAQTIFAPFVALHYEPLPDDWVSGGRLLAALLAIAAILVFAIRARRQLGKVVLFWLAWIVLVSLPTANLLKQEALFDERYELLALVGTVGIVAALASLRWHRPAFRWPATAVALAIIIVCSAISHGRAQYFKNDFAFFAQWHATSPAFDYAGNHWQIARFRMLTGEYELAAAHARATLEAAPDAWPARATLGHALLAQGEVDAAEEEFQQVAQSPGGDQAGAAGLAAVSETRGEWQKAASYYRTALSHPPVVDETARRYAWLLATCPEDVVRDGVEAIRWAQVAVDSPPQASDAPSDVIESQRSRALDTLAAAQAEAGQIDQAIYNQLWAIRLASPEEAVAMEERLRVYIQRAQQTENENHSPSEGL